MLTLITLLAMLAAAGAVSYAARQSALRQYAERHAVLERAILRAAMLNRGRVTAFDVEPRNVGTLAEIEDRLRSMYARGHCESEVTSDGRHVYLFSSYDDSEVRMAAVQKQLFLLAKIHGGYVDLTKAAMASELTYQQLRDVLEEMVEDGLCARAEEPATYWFPSLAAKPRPALPSAVSDLAEPHSSTLEGDRGAFLSAAEFDVDSETGIVIPRSER